MSTIVASTKEVYQFSATPKTVKSRAKYRDSAEKKSPEGQKIKVDAKVRNINFNSPSSKTTLRGTKTEVEESLASPNHYLVLTDKPAQNEATLIPDYYVDKPPTPEYKPLEPGVEVATQVENFELFDFILEVEPVLQVLVGKTLEQAQMELREEDERTEEKKHRAAFEKKRNAELMVTQRKEALHIRKQEEKQRREKQVTLQKEESIITHKKYISRLLAKNTSNGMIPTAINILNNSNVLGLSFNTELKKEYIPHILQKVQSRAVANQSKESKLQEIISEISNRYIAAHTASVQTEFDRKKKIAEDKKALEERLAAEKKYRRERRKQLRFYYASTSLLEKIQADVVSKPQEIENPFAADIVDLASPANQASVATVGGLLGEIWLVLDVLQSQNQVELKTEELVQIFVALFSNKLKSKEFPIYFNEQDQQAIQDIQKQMEEDLIEFNKNKYARIEELVNKLSGVNLHQNLQTLYSQSLLNPAVLKQINTALLHILFSSVDYKIPEKKVEPVEEKPKEEGEEGKDKEANEQEDKPAEEQAEEKPQEAEEVQEKPEEQENQEEGEKPQGEEAAPVENKESVEEGGEKKEEEAPPVEVPQPVVEEFKLPEITPLELTLVELSKNIKINYLKEWEFTRNFDAIVRIRVPLNRVIPEEKPTEETEKEEEEVEKTISSARRRKHKKSDPVVTEPETVVEEPAPVVEAQPQEDFAEKVARLVQNDEFIEPYNGTTFEKEQENFPQQSVADKTLKIYNTTQVEGKHIGQINERVQGELRKELLALIQGCVPEWNGLPNEEVIGKVNEKYVQNEREIINGLTKHAEVPVFDIETA